MLYNVAGLVDSDNKRARSFLHSLAQAAERGANTSLHVYALRAEYSLAVMNAEFADAERLETALANFADARSYRDSFGYRHARALFHISKTEFRLAESTLRAIPAASLSASERAVCEALLAVLDLIRDNRSGASRSIERGLLSDAAHDFWGRTEIARAHALRGLAFWALDRPAQARKSFGIDSGDLPAHDRVLIDAYRTASELPHPLSNPEDVDPMCAALEAADFTAYSTLLRALVARHTNDVELSAAEIETLREFDRVGGRAVDVAAALGKSRYTVQNQIQSAIRKLGCSGRAEAIAYARKRGWLDTTS
jgi:DNA-binding CsgD family transcriptional regulator